MTFNANIDCQITWSSSWWPCTDPSWPFSSRPETSATRSGQSPWSWQTTIDSAQSWLEFRTWRRTETGPDEWFFPRSFVWPWNTCTSGAAWSFRHFSDLTYLWKHLQDFGSGSCCDCCPVFCRPKSSASDSRAWFLYPWWCFMLRRLFQLEKFSKIFFLWWLLLLSRNFRRERQRHTWSFHNKQL